MNAKWVGVHSEEVVAQKFIGWIDTTNLKQRPKAKIYLDIIFCANLH